MEKELEELSKTTDVLKEFKSRVGQEDKTEDIEELIKEWKEEETNKQEDNKKINNSVENVALTEEIKKSNMDLGYLDDDTTLELSDIELDKTVILDENTKNNEISDSDELTNKVETFFTSSEKS